MGSFLEEINSNVVQVISKPAIEGLPGAETLRAEDRTFGGRGSNVIVSLHAGDGERLKFAIGVERYWN